MTERHSGIFVESSSTIMPPDPSIDPGMHATGMRAGDFDGDGASEMLLLTDGGVLYELEASGDSYRQSWMYPFALQPRPRALATARAAGGSRRT